jgi:hypothetical protein
VGRVRDAGPEARRVEVRVVRRADQRQGHGSTPEMVFALLPAASLGAVPSCGLRAVGGPGCRTAGGGRQAGHRRGQGLAAIARRPLKATGSCSHRRSARRWSRRNVLRRFEALAERAGLRGVHLHTLRHSAASFLLAAGTHTKVVQEHLGHSSYTITADIYSHVAPVQQREAADNLGQAIHW